jgi:hypothetical protein
MWQLPVLARALQLFDCRSRVDPIHSFIDGRYRLVQYCDSVFDGHGFVIGIAIKGLKPPTEYRQLLQSMYDNTVSCEPHDIAIRVICLPTIYEWDLADTPWNDGPIRIPILF